MKKYINSGCVIYINDFFNLITFSFLRTQKHLITKLKDEVLSSICSKVNLFNSFKHKEMHSTL